MGPKKHCNGPEEPTCNQYFRACHKGFLLCPCGATLDCVEKSKPTAKTDISKCYSLS